MNGKVFIVLSFCLLNIVFGSENNLTGNFRIDLINAATDSIVETKGSVLNDGRQQNPFLNGLYSLAIPGAGQVRTGHYTKTAIFLSVEIGLIAYAVVSNNNGDKKTNEFQAYAEAHWDAERYARWINAHGVADYGPTTSFSSDDFKTITEQKDFSKINAWESGLHKLGFSHQLPVYQSQQYYELIGKYHQFKFGWDTYQVDANGVPVSDNGQYDNLLSSEKQFKDYAVERGKANDYYYAASFAASALIINHVVSAVDAFFSTKSFNKEITAAFRITPVDGLEGKRLLSEVKVQISF